MSKHKTTEQTASEIAKILNNESIPTKVRLEEMKKYLKNENLSKENTPLQNVSESYNTTDFRKAAIRNQFIKKK